MVPEDIAATEAVMATAIAPSEEFEQELEIAAGPSAGRWIQWRGRVQVDKPWIINGVSFDVTERRQERKRLREGEDALRESEARFRALAIAGSYLIYRMSPDWRVMHQPDGGDILADTPEPDEDWAASYILPADQLVVFAVIAEAIRSKSLFQLEHRVRRADGSVSWVFSRAVPILGPNGEIVEWFGAATDVTDRRMAQERRRESEELLALAFSTLPVGSRHRRSRRDGHGERRDAAVPAERQSAVSRSRA